MSDQLTLDDALDELGGFDGWAENLPCPPWVDTRELADSAGCSPRVMDTVLEEEERRGHVERAAGGGWRATPKLVRDYGRGFGDLTLGSGER